MTLCCCCFVFLANYYNSCFFLYFYERKTNLHKNRLCSLWFAWFYIRCKYIASLNIWHFVAAVSLLYITHAFNVFCFLTKGMKKNDWTSFKSKSSNLAHNRTGYAYRFVLHRWIRNEWSCKCLRLQCDCGSKTLSGG